MEQRYCKKCDQKKLLTEEFWHHSKRKKDGWEYYCKECIRQITKKNYNKSKVKWREYQTKFKTNFKNTIIDYKKTLKCSKCSEDRWYALDFHHLDPKEKSFAIGNAWCYKSMEDAFKEIKKCIPLCKNCHAEFHHLEKLNNITIKEYINI